MLAAERQQAILRALHAGGAVRVADLAAELDVSEMTVRRDLDALDAMNLLRKVHGGAVNRHNRGEEPWSSVKAAQQRDAKAAIAAVAADTVEDGMTIAISAGTTTTELGRRLRHRPSITVITNSVSVFRVLTDPAADGADAPQVYLTGGCSHPVRRSRRADRRRRDRILPGRRDLPGCARARPPSRPDHTEHR